MRLFIRLAFAMLLLGCLVAAAGAGEGPPPTQAQAQPKLEAPKQTYAELEAAARKLLSAYSGGDADKLFDILAVPRRNSCALSLARALKRFDEKPERFDNYKKKLEGLDPSGKMKIKSIEDLRLVRPSEFFALSTGMLKASATEAVSKRLKGQWFMLEREIGLTQLRELRGAAEIVSRGFVSFENIEGDKVTVSCMPDDDGWRMESFHVKVGDFQYGFNGRLAGGGAQQLSDVALSEAHAALGAMKDRGRVVFYRKQSTNVTKEDLGLGRTELDGSFFTDECYAVVNTDVHSWVAICKPKNSDGPIVCIIANLEEGVSEFFDYSDEDEMALNPPKLEMKK